MHDFSIPTALKLASVGATLRNEISQLLRQDVTLSHEISDKRKALQVVSDQIINEIWSNELYKNDKARNEQKHLAAINDERLIVPGDAIKKLELQRADVQAKIVTSQNLMAYNLAEYELTTLGSRRMQVSYHVSAVIDEGVDTIKRASIDSGLQSLMRDPSQLDEYLKKAAAAAAAAQTAAPDEVAGQQPDPYACACDGKPFNHGAGCVLLTGVQPAPADEAAPLTDKEAQAQAPYLKNTSDKTPGKLGGVRY